MQTIDVSIQIKAPLERVFTVLSDHESYKNLNGVLSAKLLKSGDTETNGKGAIRQLDAPGITFVEEIPAFERNNYFDYKVIRCYMNLGLIQIDIPLHHELGRLTFTKRDDGTYVNWISIIDLEISFLKEQATKAFSFFGSESFLMMLRQFKEKLESSSI